MELVCTYMNHVCCTLFPIRHVVAHVAQCAITCVCVYDWVSGRGMLAYNGCDTFVYSDPAAAFPPPKPLVYYEFKV